MLCPYCNTSLKEVRRTSVAMNLCPRCKGVWLTHEVVQTLCDRVHALEQAWNTEHRRRCAHAGVRPVSRDLVKQRQHPNYRLPERWCMVRNLSAGIGMVATLP